MFNLVGTLRDIMKTHKLDSNLKLKIKTIDGDIVVGPYGGFTQALDNEPELASLEIKKDGYNIELYENEIEFIEIL